MSDQIAKIESELLDRQKFLQEKFDEAVQTQKLIEKEFQKTQGALDVVQKLKEAPVESAEIPEKASKSAKRKKGRSTARRS